MRGEIRPQLWIVAGPNGAGKSTLVARHAFAQQIPIINPDEIANRILLARGGGSGVLALAA